MRLLYLFGNGFDIHVGLKTGYPDFLKYYLDQPLPTQVDEVGQRYIKRLKEDIQGNIKLWSDLELQFGKHMSKLGTMGSKVHSLQEELDIINDDIREKLSQYISTQDEISYFADESRKMFLSDIIAPEQHLRDYERADVLNHRSNVWNRTANTVDIITFNYTRTIEHILGNEAVKSADFNINQPVHVHGYFDQRMILGVNDASQIENDELRKLTYAKDALVKSSCNHSYGAAHTDECCSLINKAQMICCYGLSFGQTDKLWWKKICDELRNRGDLIVVLFLYINNLPSYANSGHKLQNKMRHIQDKFLSMGGVPESERVHLTQRLYVSINDPLFNFQIDESTPMYILSKK